MASKNQPEKKAPAKKQNDKAAESKSAPPNKAAVGLKDASGNSVETITLDKDIFGNPYLPGNEVTVPKELYMAVHANESSKADMEKLKKRVLKDQQNLAAATIKFRSIFEGTKDGLHFVFNCAGVDVLVDRNEKVSTKPETSVASGKRKKTKAGDEKAIADVY